MCRIAFFVRPNITLSLRELGNVLSQKGARTFMVERENKWSHRRYGSTVTWSHDPNTNIFTALVSGGEAIRTCGSLVEWMLRNAGDYLHDPVALQGVSVFG